MEFIENLITTYILAIIFALILYDVMLITIAVKLADLKGRDSFVWGIITFFFGVISVFILAIIYDYSTEYYRSDSYFNKPEHAEKVSTDSDTVTPSNSTWRCPNCGVVNNTRDRECSACCTARKE